MLPKIIIGSDHAGFVLKEKLKGYLAKKKFAVTDVGTFTLDSCDYPDFVQALASPIVKKKFLRGIFICKSGIGSAIAANKFPGIRAALCYHSAAARLSREHNDSNVLVLGAAFVSTAEAKKIVSVWLRTEFCGGRHKRRLNKIKKIEKKLIIGKELKRETHTSY